MRPLRLLLATTLLGVLARSAATAQQTDGAQQREVAQQQQPGSAEAEAKPPAWEFGASLYGYFVPQDRDYASPIVTADHGGLHLEGRYNYEGPHAGSVFVGWNTEAGSKLHMNLTAIIGGVFGDTRGVAPGYELTLTWKSFELYSEGEYVIDVNDSSENFFYNWAQLGYSPLDWLTVGLASQRTRAYHTDLDVQRGLFVTLTHKSVSLSTYVFNFGWESPTVIVSLAVKF